MASDNRSSRVRRVGQLSSALFFFCSSTLADANSNARDHFARGVELAQRGEFDTAATEFEQAYRLRPNYAVLYNLGQAYFQVGKSVEALRAFESYLENAPANMDAGRRRDVEELITQCRKRVGFVYLEADSEATGGEVSVDGRPIGKAPLAGPITLLVGTHGVTVSLPGRKPFIGKVEVEPGRTSLLHVSLDPRAPERSLPVPLGQLVVESPVPAVGIAIDDVVTDQTEAPLLVALGHHRVTCSREGYASIEVGVEVQPGLLARVVCDLKPRNRLAATQMGILSFNVSESGVQIWIDGHPSGGTAQLPSGPHAVRVHHGGFSDWAETVNARPGFPQRISVQLRPTPEHALELQRRASSRRTWAYVLGSTGLALIGTGAALYAVNNSRYSAWQRENDALARDLQMPNGKAQLSQQTGDVRNFALSIQRQDDAALGATIVGGVLLTYAFASWLDAN